MLLKSSPRCLGDTLRDRLRNEVDQVCLACGAYMTGALGVPTLSYFPYVFFNPLNPLISAHYSITGFQVTRIEPGTPSIEPTPLPVMATPSVVEKEG